MVLEIRNLTKIFQRPAGPVRAVSEVSLSLGAGEFVMVRGPSGSGKTTLLLASGGLLKPDGGQVLVEEQDLYAMSYEERARFRRGAIGFVFQQFHLIPYLDVLENVLAASIAKPEPDALGRAKELISQLNLGERIGHLPSELSTGERQRVALGRAFLNRPKVILADEPTGNLDGENGEIVLRALADFAGEGGAVLLVTHDPGAGKYAHRTVQLEKGSLNPEPDRGMTGNQ